MDADRLRPARGLLEKEKLAPLACRLPPSGTLTTHGCLACPVWLWVAESVTDIAVALPASTEHIRNRYQTLPAAELTARDGVVVMGGQWSSSGSHCAGLHIKVSCECRDQADSPCGNMQTLPAVCNSLGTGCLQQQSALQLNEYVCM